MLSITASFLRNSVFFPRVPSMRQGGSTPDPLGRWTSRCPELTGEFHGSRNGTIGSLQQPLFLGDRFQFCSSVVASIRVSDYLKISCEGCHQNISLASSIAWRLCVVSGREASKGTTSQPCARSRPSIRVLRVCHSRSSFACIRPATLSGRPVGCQRLLCWNGKRDRS